MHIKWIGKSSELKLHCFCLFDAYSMPKDMCSAQRYRGTLTKGQIISKLSQILLMALSAMFGQKVFLLWSGGFLKLLGGSVADSICQVARQLESHSTSQILNK